MVEVLYCRPTIISQDELYSPAPALRGSFSRGRMMTREEHMLKEMSLRKSGLRRGPPKRSQTITDYAVDVGTTAELPATPSAVPRLPSMALSKAIPRKMPQMPEVRRPAAEPEKEVAAVDRKEAVCRPRLGSPRRSYSVMDFEPVLGSEQPSSGLSFTDLPIELHYEIFDHLDPIDSTCLGLTSRHFYNIHKRFHGLKVPLNARRSGPNDVEWAWRLAGQLACPKTPPEHARDALIGLANFRVRGAVYCRKCGASKCELHRHIEEWIGDGYEYCAVQEKFTRPAPVGVRQECYRRKPNDPHQCGRHRRRTRRA